MNVSDIMYYIKDVVIYSLMMALLLFFLYTRTSRFQDKLDEQREKAIQYELEKDREKRKKKAEKDMYFNYVNSYGSYDFLYDKFTEIMYVQYSVRKERAMSVLYNKKGKPMTYSEWSNPSELVYFLNIGGLGDYDFLYDRYTEIMYIQYSVRKKRAMSVLCNKDGKPMKSSEWRKLGADSK